MRQQQPCSPPLPGLAARAPRRRALIARPLLPCPCSTSRLSRSSVALATLAIVVAAHLVPRPARARALARLARLAARGPAPRSRTAPSRERRRGAAYLLLQTTTYCAERGQPLGGGCARPAGLGVLRSAAHRRAEFRLPVWLRGVYFIIAVHHAFVSGLGARHGGIVKLSVVRCVTVFACFTSFLPSLPFLPWAWQGAKRGTEGARCTAVARGAHGLATHLLATGQPTQPRAWQTNSRLARS